MRILNHGCTCVVSMICRVPKVLKNKNRGEAIWLSTTWVSGRNNIVLISP